MAPTGTGPVTLTLLANGVPVPGAIGTDTPAAASDAITLTVTPPVVRQMVHAAGTVLTLQVSAAGVVSNVAMSVVKEV